MSERQGVEIDYCPQCRGVWLDRGELDKIIERSSQELQPTAPPPPPPAQPAPGYSQPHGQPYAQPYTQPYGQPQGYSQPYYGKHKRKKSFLEELFD